MAEGGYEPYHVPQQSRRDKLRVSGCVQNLQGCAGLLPLYDPCSLLSSDLLTCANLHHHHHHHHQSTTGSSNSACCCSSCGVVKEEGSTVNNFMGTTYVGNIINNASSSSSTVPNHQIYNMDPQSSSIHVSPSSIQEMNNNINPFLYNNNNNTTQNLRIFDQSFINNGGGGGGGGGGGHEVVVYKPEPLSINPNGNGQAGGLSLSLSSHQYQSNNNIPLELNLQRYDYDPPPPSVFNNNKTPGTGGYHVIPAIIGGSTSNNDVSRISSVPLGPFTGYTSILKGSKFLRPAQQLLEELCFRGTIYGGPQKITPQDSISLMNSPIIESLTDQTGNFDDSLASGDGRKKPRLISMLDEVYRRYKHYYQQMQAVVASFESVAGLSNAAPYANLALNAMSKHFKCLKNAIADQLQFTSKVQGHINYRKDESPRFENSDRNLYSQRPVNNSGFLEHQPVWRPQRGLPERAVSVLRAWLFEHFLHPYPTDTDKLMLAKQTGLSRSQVSNWFINARVRLWKPMVEEIHMLETRQASKPSEREEQNADRASNHFSTAPSTSSHRTQDLRSKRTRNDIPDISITNEEQMNLTYDSLSHHPNGGFGVSNAGGSGGVSLTLGLHQNNGLVMTDPPFPVNAGQRFGLDGNGEGYVIGGFEAPNRQFGRDIMGSQLLHDFVG